MKCPICGSKIKQNKCIYCNITSDQIINASNTDAKIAIKQKQRENVYYSSYLPNDVNRTKLLLFTVFFGLFGVSDFYVGKKGKAWFHIISLVVMFTFAIFYELSGMYDWGVESSFLILMSNWGYLAMIAILVWFRDVIKAIIKRTAVPVVLAPAKVEVKTKNKRLIKD